MMSPKAKRLARFALLALYYLHVGAVVVAVRRGLGAAAKYMKEVYRSSKTTAGAYLPPISVEEIVTVPVEFKIYRPDSWCCSMSLSEISALCYLVAYRKPRKILEVGTYRGLTTLNLALNAPQAEVHTVDITDAWGSYYYAERPEIGNIKQHHGDSNTFDFRTQVGPGVDFCLIDGGHSYAQVRNDTLKALPLMVDDGILLWDDYGRNDFLSEVESFRVSQFMHEIKACGICVLRGTGLAFLQLDRETREKLTAHLEQRPRQSSRPATGMSQIAST
jgi:hypothetical protein